MMIKDGSVPLTKYLGGGERAGRDYNGSEPERELQYDLDTEINPALYFLFCLSCQCCHFATLPGAVHSLL